MNVKLQIRKAIGVSKNENWCSKRLPPFDLLSKLPLPSANRIIILVTKLRLANLCTVSRPHHHHTQESRRIYWRMGRSRRGHKWTPPEDNADHLKYLKQLIIRYVLYVTCQRIYNSQSLDTRQFTYLPLSQSFLSLQLKQIVSTTKRQQSVTFNANINTNHNIHFCYLHKFETIKSKLRSG